MLPEAAGRAHHFQDRGHGIFYYSIRSDPKPANNLFIFFLTLSNQLFNSLSSTHTIQTHLVIKICFEKKALIFFSTSLQDKSSFQKMFCT